MAVLLSPVGGVAAQFFDNSGNVLTGGKIYTYAAGTTTPQVTYTNASGTTFHSNPIILDAAGRVSAGGEIWLTDGSQYKFVIKDANDVLIGTYDNIVGINSNYINFVTEEEIQVATAGQTIFTLTTMQYQPGANNLSVFVDGVNQYDGISYAYVETDSTTVTFTAGLHVGALVKFTTATSISGGGTSASLVIYNEGDTDAVDRTVTNKLQEAISVKDFGAVGDGVTDDTAAIQAALNTGKNIFIPDGSFFFTLPLLYTANNQAIYGNGNTSILKHEGIGSSGTSWISTEGYDNVSFCNLQLDSGYDTNAGNPCLFVKDGSQNITINNVYFNGGNQVVYLGACSNVKVVNSTFDRCGYGVIQKNGFSSSHVLVDGNTCINAYLDFVEANCTSSAPSENWVISNNTYDTNINFPTPITEGRFVGITSVRGVVITGNTVKKAAGDAVIHLEDTLGDTIISSNVIDNCLVSGGNSGYLFLLNSAENTVVSDNIFLRTDATLGAVYALSVNSDSYNNPMVITGNLVRGEASGGNLNGFNLSFQTTTSSTTCAGNTFQDLNNGIFIQNSYNANISSNSFVRCTTGITSNVGTLLDSIINGNNFVNTAGTNDIVCAAATRVDVQNNRFSKAVNLGNCTDVLVNDNAFNSTATLVAPAGTRAYAPSNIFESVAVSQTRYQNIGSAYQLSSSKRAAVIGGSAVATFRITCAATTLGWRPGIINIRASACDANSATFTAAWWAYKFQILGSDTNTNEATEDSGGTVGSYSISFTNVSASATAVVFDVAVTATNADYVAVDLSSTYYQGIESIV